MSITKKSKIYSTCLFIFFVIVAIITLLPLALLAVSSLRPGSDLMRYGLNFSIDWANANLNEYKNVIQWCKFILCMVQKQFDHYCCAGCTCIVPECMCRLWICNV